MCDYSYVCTHRDTRCNAAAERLRDRRCLKHSILFSLTNTVSHCSKKKTCYLRPSLLFFVFDLPQPLPGDWYNATWTNVELQQWDRVGRKLLACFDQTHCCHLLLLCWLLSLLICWYTFKTVGLKKKKITKNPNCFYHCVFLLTSVDDYLDLAICHVSR